MAMPPAPTVDHWLAALAPERRALVARVRDLVNAHLPAGYDEVVRGSMLSWEIPLATHPHTYNKQPLQYAALASQKAKVSLYLMAPYVDPALEASLQAAWAAAGKRLDMGKSCLRFATWDDLVPDAVGRCIAAMPPAAFIAAGDAARAAAAAARR